MQAALALGQPDWQWEPTLIEIGHDDVRVSTGLALHIRLVSLVGLRQAWQIAQLVAAAQVPLVAAAQSRRGLMKRGATLAAGVVGLTLLGPAPDQARAQVGSVEAQARNRPGRYSRREGIKSWRVKKQGSGYTVRFKHKNPKLSGTVKVSYGGGGKTLTWVLTRRGDRVQLGYSGRTASGTDGKGGAMTFRLNTKRARWEYNARTGRVARGSRTDLRLGAAISTDLHPRLRSRRASSEQQGGDQSRSAAPLICTRSEEHRLAGETPFSLIAPVKALACEEATLDVEQKCEESIPLHCNGSADGCCHLIEDCSCGGILSLIGLDDFGAWCIRYGYRWHC